MYTRGKKAVAALLVALLAFTGFAASMAEGFAGGGLGTIQSLNGSYEGVDAAVFSPLGSIAQIMPSETLYSIHFFSPQGEIDQIVRLFPGEPIKEPGMRPEYPGYIFHYWFDASLGVSVPYEFGSGAYRDAWLVPYMTTAVSAGAGASPVLSTPSILAYSAGPYNTSSPAAPTVVKYQVRFFDAQGKIVSWAEVPEGFTVSMPSARPAAEGMAFAYWYDVNAEGTGSYNFNLPVTRNINLAAQMRPVSEQPGADGEWKPSPEFLRETRNVILAVTRDNMGEKQGEKVAPNTNTVAKILMSVQWLPSDSSAPDSVSAVILTGNGAPETVTLTREEGWAANAQLMNGITNPVFLLMDVEQYSTTIGDGAVRFVATLPEPDAALPQEAAPVAGGSPAEDGSQKGLLESIGDTIAGWLGQTPEPKLPEPQEPEPPQSQPQALEDEAFSGEMFFPDAKTPEEGGATSAGMMRLSIDWLPSDASAPDSAVALIVTGDGKTERVKLTRAGGWSKLVQKSSDTSALASMLSMYMLIGIDNYVMAAGDSEVKFTVTLPAMPPLPLLPEKDSPPPAADADLPAVAQDIVNNITAPPQEQPVFEDMDSSQDIVGDTFADSEDTFTDSEEGSDGEIVLDNGEGSDAKEVLDNDEGSDAGKVSYIVKGSDAGGESVAGMDPYTEKVADTPDTSNPSDTSDTMEETGAREEEQTNSLDNIPPDGATRLSVRWLPSDAGAPDTVTAVVIAGSGIPEKVVLTREDGWVNYVKSVGSPASLAYMLPIYLLMDIERYTAAIGDSDVVFTASVPEKPAEDPPSGTQEAEEKIIVIDQDEIPLYNEKDSMVGDLPDSGAEEEGPEGDAGDSGSNDQGPGPNQETNEKAGREELPEGMIRLSIKWLPYDAGELDSVAVMVFSGDSYLGDVALSREEGWTRDVHIANDSETLVNMDLMYMLRDIEYDYTAYIDGGMVSMQVTLPGIAGGPEEAELQYAPLNPDRKVSIRAALTLGQEVAYGDTITLVATLTGYEGLDYTTMWKVNRGNGWETLEDSGDLWYSFVLDEENVFWSFMMEVTIHHPAWRRPAASGPVV